MISSMNLPEFTIVFTVLIILTLACSITEAQSDKIKKVDEILKEWDSTTSPGCAVAVIQDNKIIHARGYGMANLDYGIANSANSVFRIGSTAKQFTAASVLALDEQGKLSINDDIRKYFPELPDYGQEITIRHLISHTSGIRDYLVLQWLSGVDDEANYSPAEVVEILARQKELNFQPGDEFLYSNSGYLLLGELVKRVSGLSLADFAEKTFFKPLGMNNTHYHDDNTRIVKNRATGYSKSMAGFRIDETINEIVGDGGVFTTVNDLAIWDKAFYSNDVLPAGFFDRMHETVPLNDGKPQKYAFGLGVGSYRGLKTVRHGGAFVGFRAEMLRFPDQKFTVVSLGNCAQFRPEETCDQIADVFLEDHFTEEMPEGESRRHADEHVEGTALTASQLQDYSGDFYCPELMVTYVLSSDGNSLKMRFKHKPGFFPLSPKENDTFESMRGRFIFKREGDGKITGFSIEAGRVKNITFIKTDN